MRYGFQSVAALAALLVCVSPTAAYADSHALICHTAAAAKDMVRIVDGAPKPVKINNVLGIMRSRGVKCTVVFAALEYKTVVETVSLADDDYEIVRVRVNEREFFTFRVLMGVRV